MDIESLFKAPYVVTGYELGKVIGALPVLPGAPGPTANIMISARYDPLLGISLPRDYVWDGEGDTLAISEAFLTDSLGLIVTSEGILRLGAIRLRLIGRSANASLIYARRIEGTDDDRL